MDPDFVCCARCERFFPLGMDPGILDPADRACPACQIGGRTPPVRPELAARIRRVERALRGPGTVCLGDEKDLALFALYRAFRARAVCSEDTLVLDRALQLLQMDPSRVWQINGCRVRFDRATREVELLPSARRLRMLDAFFHLRTAGLS